MAYENELEKIIDYIGDSANDVVTDIFNEQAKNTSFRTERDYAPYGDTEVEVCRYTNEEDEERFREEMEKDMDVDYIIDKLKDDKHFRESIQDLIKYVVWNTDLEV